MNAPIDAIPSHSAMKLRTLTGWMAAALLVIGSVKAGGGTVAIRRTPILNATLPSGTTYQIEYSSNGIIPWLPTGVIVAGTGSPSSVRLDGFSDRLSYRYSRIGATALVTPVITNGLSLSNSFPGAVELRIESTTALTSNAWMFRKFAFPDFNGTFINAVRTPTQAFEFFRAGQPAVPLDLASVVSYTADPNSGYAGFGSVADDMPQLYRDGFIGAVCPAFYHRGGSNALAAGECYELTGPIGTATVIVADMDDVAPAGTCDAGRSYFDIGTPAFTNLFAESSGVGTATFRLVPAPVTGNLKMYVPISSGGFYFELRPYNHRAGISKIEIRSTGSSTWVDLPRAVYNSFIYSGGAATFPLSVRVTSRFGEVLHFPNIASLSAGQRLTATNQFAQFPGQAPAPVWILPPVYRDSLSNILGGTWTVSPYSGPVVNLANPNAAYQGAAGLSISNLTAFSGVIFNSPLRFSQPADSTLEFAIRSATATAATNLAVQINGYDNTGAAANSSTVLLPAIDHTWRVIRLPLVPALAPFQIKSFRIMNNAATTLPPVYLDSIQFRQP